MKTIPLAFAIFLTTLSLSQAATIRPGTAKLELLKDGKDQPIAVLWIEGAIAYPMADQIREQLEKLEPELALAIDFDSEGGSVEEGHKIIALIEKEKTRRKDVNTVVQNGNVCGSMCVPLYVQGKLRVAGEMSAFMFHGATRFSYTNIPEARKTQELLELFRRAGVSADWIQSLEELGVFSKPGEYWISGKELMEANSGVVTKLRSRHEVKEPWRAPFDPNIRPR